MVCGRFLRSAAQGTGRILASEYSSNTRPAKPHMCFVFEEHILERSQKLLDSIWCTY